MPPRVSPAQEVVQLKKDLDDMGVEYDENGINEYLQKPLNFDSLVTTVRQLTE